MDDPRNPVDGPHGIEGSDDAALGVAPAPESAPSAEVDADEQLVPGAGFDDRPAVASKPWFTSLAAGSDQAGVANDPPDAQAPEFPTSDEDPR